MISAMPQTAQAATERLLDRIATVDVDTNAVCTLHPDALAQAAAARPGGRRGAAARPAARPGRPGQGQRRHPDLPTTAGSLALADAPRRAGTRRSWRGSVPPAWSSLGKTNLSEWANIRDECSTSGWSAYGGLTRNPYALNRSAGGSSSGSGAAVAAGLAPFAIGTETDGSIICPAAFNGCVGIKPTVGLVPTAGVVPISRVAGLARPDGDGRVREAAALLGVLAGDGVDYAAHAVGGRLAGKRIGVPRRRTGATPRTPTPPPSGRSRCWPPRAPRSWTTPTCRPSPESVWEDELVVLLAELRAGLAGTSPPARATCRARWRTSCEFNRDHADVELAHFGQSLFEQALAGPGVGDPSTSRRAPAAWRPRAHDGIDRVLREHELDALVTPSYAPASPIDLVNPERSPAPAPASTAMAGYPLLTVPTELAAGLPVAVSFWGAAGSEATLVEIAHGYEEARDRTTGPLPEPTYPTFARGRPIALPRGRPRCPHATSWGWSSSRASTGGLAAIIRTPESRVPSAPTQRAAVPVSLPAATAVKMAPPMIVPGWLIAPMKAVPVARQLPGSTQP